MHQSKYLILLLVVLLPAKLFAQPSFSTITDITGLWKGTLYNDSAQKYYSYEIGISEEKGKLSGFSHTWFILDDKQYYGVKKVKIKKAGDGKIIIEDAGLIANNYPVSPAKGVRQLNILTLEIKDSIMTLTGPFSTNRTKEYSSLTGTVSLQRKNDFWQSALVPHLQELGLSHDLSFVKKENDVAKVAEDKKNADRAEETTVNIIHEKSNRVDKEEADTIKPIMPKEIASTIHEKKETLPGKPVKVKASPSASVSVPDVKKETSPARKSLLPAADLSTRTTIIQQTVYYTSDSLQLSLYDNGEVDGDTVSVLMNGDIIMPKAGLSTNAVRKTIYTGQGNDSIALVMYAENLGAIAPNTGLLVVHDGKNIYEIRFSGDLQKNASIILRRRKN